MTTDEIQMIPTADLLDELARRHPTGLMLAAVHRDTTNNLQQALAAKDAELAAAKQVIENPQTLSARSAASLQTEIEKWKAWFEDECKKTIHLKDELIEMHENRRQQSKELAAANEQIGQLRGWKESAMSVLSEWDDTYEACGSPGQLGGSKAKALRDRFEQLLAENVRLKDERNHSLDREFLGKLVRMTWVDWASKQLCPKPSWLIPWEALDEVSKEVDRQIGEAVAGVCVSPHLLLAEQENDKLREENERLKQERASAIAGRIEAELLGQTNVKLTARVEQLESETAIAGHTADRLRAENLRWQKRCRKWKG